MSGATVRSSRAAVPRGAALQPSATPTGARLELVEREQSQRRRRSMLLCAFLGAALVGGPFVVVSMHVRMAQQQYHLDQLHREIEVATRENREARAKVANMSSADWIVPQAKRLGLEQPTSVKVLTIDQTPNANGDAGAKNADGTATDNTPGADGTGADGPVANDTAANDTRSADATHP